MSATSTTGAPASSATRMFATSTSHRLISAGLPAPSAITRSIEALVQPVERLLDPRPQGGGPSSPRGLAELRVDPPEHNDLTPVVRLGLDEDRVHPDVRGGGRRGRLQG